MKRIVIAAGCALACCASAGIGAATAAAELPELGRCIEVATKTGKYGGSHCVSPSKTGKGRYEWLPGPGARKKFTANVESPVLQGAGASKLNVKCEFGEVEGEYTSEKAASITKLLLLNCRTPLKPGEAVIKTWCQNVGAFRGEVTAQELTGELGYIERSLRTLVGLDVKAKTGKALAIFECGGALEVGEHGTGTGTLVEVEGSVIGRVKKIDSMAEENLVTFTVKNGAQVPEQLEGGAKDTLITNVGVTKTAEPSTFSGFAEVTNQEPLEIKAK
jgi:hypothetical protein